MGYLEGDLPNRAKNQRKYTRYVGTVVAIAFLAAAALVVTTRGILWEHQTTLSGIPEVVSGSCLRFGIFEVPLHNVRAPKASQTCGASGWSCGAEAAAFLRNHIQSSGQEVRCNLVEAGPGSIKSGVCQQDGVDLAELLVTNGWAVVDGEQQTQLQKAMRHAMGSELGIWKGGFQPDELWSRTAGVISHGVALSHRPCPLCEWSVECQLLALPQMIPF